MSFENTLTDQSAANTFAEHGTVGYTTGKYGQALDLDGSNDIYLAGNLGLAYNAAQSYSFYFKIKNGDIGMLYDNWYQGNPGTYYQLEWNGTILNDNHYGEFSFTDDGAWHHLVMSSDGSGTGGRSYYLDGTFIGTGDNYSGSYDWAATNLDFGSYFDGSSNNDRLEVDIDDFAVFDRALTEEEISFLNTHELSDCGGSEPTPTSTDLAALGNIQFGLGILIVLALLGYISYLHGHLFDTKKKQWLS